MGTTSDNKKVGIHIQGNAPMHELCLSLHRGDQDFEVEAAVPLPQARELIRAAHDPNPAVFWHALNVILPAFARELSTERVTGMRDAFIQWRRFAIEALPEHLAKPGA